MEVHACPVGAGNRKCMRDEGLEIGMRKPVDGKVFGTRLYKLHDHGRKCL